MNRFWTTVTVIAASAAAFSTSGFGQTVEQPIILTIEVDNVVAYRGDVTDSAKLARDPGATAPLPARAFQFTYNVGDVAAINGKPAKGLMSTVSGTLVPRVLPQPGQMIADFDGGGPYLGHWQVLASDGSSIGTLATFGGVLQPDQVFTILSGSGAFLGVSGETRTLEMVRTPRVASVTEDPANRRVNGGGKARFLFHFYPKCRPSVETTSGRPAVYHGDFSPVTASNPARAGELLIAAARNLGPTRPELLPPGTRPFKSNPLEVVNSPVEVTVNEKDADVINKIGWPGTSDLYRVDFRVPEGLAPGMVTLQLTAAWIPGPEVKIPVQ